MSLSNWVCRDASSILSGSFFFLAAYLELLLLHYYGFSQDDDETPAKRQKLENGTAKIGRLLIITPVNPAERGCQLSVKFSTPVKSLREELDKRGVVVSFKGSKIKSKT